MTRTPFYVISFQRSGSTLLCHLLDKHPDVLCLEEPEITKRIAFRQYALLKDARFDSLKKLFDFYGTPPGSYVELANRYTNGEMDAESFILSFFALLNKKGARVVGAKEVCDLAAYRLDYLGKLTGLHENGVRFVFIQRNLEPVVHSFYKLGFFPPGKKPLDFRNMKRFVREYRHCLGYMTSHMKKHGALFVHYERLLDDPRRELKKIFEFLDVDSSKPALERCLSNPSRGVRIRFDGIDRGRNDLWRSHLPPDTAAWIKKFDRRTGNGFTFLPDVFHRYYHRLFS